MPIRVFDSLRRRKVDLDLLAPGTVSMYLCGPTVYAEPHIGHARSAICFDVVARHLAWSGLKVCLVRNLTDVDDKIIRKAAERGIPADEHARENAAIYTREMLAVGNR